MASVSEIRVAYLLLAHKNPEQVNIFINQLLENGSCDIYVHIDKQNSNMADEIVDNEHVFVCSEFATRWASFEICKAALKLMELAVSSGRTYSHVYFGSGQDLMVKKGFYEFLASNENKVFMHIIREVTSKDRAASRYKVRWSKKLMRRNDIGFSRLIRFGLQMLCRMGIVFKRNKKKLNRSVKFYTGGTWFIAPIDAIEYIIKYVAENPEYIDFWEESLASDLMFFQTILMNSEYKDVIQEQLMYIRFGETKRTRNHPITVSIADDVEIEKNNYFFARKFEIAEKETINYYLDKVKTKQSQDRD